MISGISQTGFKSAQPTYTTVHRGSTTNADSPPTTLQPPEAVVQQQQQNAPQPQSVVSWVTTTVQDNQSGLQPNSVATTNWDSAKISSDTNANNTGVYGAPSTARQQGAGPSENSPADLSQLSTSNVIAAAAAESLQWPAPNGTSGAGAPLSTSNVIAAAAAESLQWPNPRPTTNGISAQTRNAEVRL